MTTILISGGRIIDPSRDFDEIGDLHIAEGAVQDVNEGAFDRSSCLSIDASGMVVAPGFIDLHTHLREPGYEYKETIASGTAAAAKSGYTTLCCMPNTEPPLDCGALIRYVYYLSRQEGVIRVLPIGCISRGRKGMELADMSEMAAAGAVGFSDDGNWVSDSSLMRKAIDYSLPLNTMIIDHCEDNTLTACGQMNEGIISTHLGLAGTPSSAEEIAVARDIALAELTGAHLHIAHISTAGSVELVRQAKKRGIRLSTEVTPHHLTLTQDRVLGYNTDAKVNPPLRTSADTDALVKGLNDGTIDIIATDHAPHALNDKLCEFDMAASGISGLETAFGSLMTLVHSGKIELTLLIRKLTSAPAALLAGKFGAIGTLTPGASADVTVFDPNEEWTVDIERFVSKGKNNPLQGVRLKGKVKATIYSGMVVYRDESL
jgi:dihydroorotase